MDSDVMFEAMKAMGWDPDSEVPMANQENMELLKEINKLTGERNQLKEDLKDCESCVEKVHHHMKNVQGVISHQVKVLAAYQSEMHTEQNLKKLVDREHSKLQDDIKDKNKQLDNYKKFVASTENELCKRNHQINDMTNRIQWAKTALVDWRQAMEDGNKGYQLIERYFKDDELLAKQQNQRRQSLQDQIDKLRTRLVEMYDGKKTLEQNLECTAKLYRAAHAERRQLVHTWKTAVGQMTQREKAIESGEARLIELQCVSNKKEEEKRRYDRKLTTIIENNRQVQEAIEELNTDTSEIKEQMQILSDMVILKENDVDLLQKDLQNLSNRVQQQRSDNLHNEKYKVAKQTELDNYELVLKKLEERLVNMESKTTNLQQRLQMLEDLIETETKALNDISKETTRVNSLIFRGQQQLVKERDEEKTMEMTNDGVKVTIQAIVHNMRKTEEELQRQTAMHYELGFKCLQIERRIIVMEGGVIDPEVERRNLDYLDELEKQMAQASKLLIATQVQNVKLNDNMRKLTNVFNDDNKKLDIIYYKIKEAQSYCDGGINRMKVDTQKNQVLIVELSLLKMRVHEFEQELDSCDKSTYNLERHRMQLNRTMKDRMVEIKSQMEILSCKRKTMFEERSTMKADIADRNKHISAVRARFELSSKLLGTNEDGTLVTATQLKVEVAQEKQMLLDEGNEMNEKVLKAEKEIKAMENTLVIFNMSNNDYRQRNKQINNDETERELTEIQMNYCSTLTHLRDLRMKILKLNREIDNSGKQLECLQTQTAAALEKRLEVEEVVDKLNRELFDQNRKLERAERDLQISKKIAKRRGATLSFLELFDRDLDVRELEHRNLAALNKLADLAENEEEIGSKILRMLMDRQLKLPHQLKKTRSFASWRSDLSDFTSRDTRSSRSARSSTNLADPFSSGRSARSSTNLADSISGVRSVRSSTVLADTVSVVSITFPD